MGKIEKLLPPNEEIIALNDSYNFEAVELFRKFTLSIPISKHMTFSFPEILKRARKRRRERSWLDVEMFRNDFEVQQEEEKFDRIFYPSLTDLHENLQGFDFTSEKDLKIQLPKRFIAVHPSSIAKWKEIPALFSVKFPLPIVNVGLANERRIRDSQIENGRPLWETAEILKKAVLVVGICSSIVQLAAQIGCSTLMCHFDEWTSKYRGVFELGGTDLVCPDKSMIEWKIETLIQERK